MYSLWNFLCNPDLTKASCVPIKLVRPSRTIDNVGIKSSIAEWAGWPTGWLAGWLAGWSNLIVTMEKLKKHVDFMPG